jgi:hypothetical protein
MAPGEKQDPQGIFNIDFNEVGMRGESAGKRQAVGKNKIDKEAPEKEAVSSLDIPAFNAPMEATYARKKKPK